jgi:DNA-binding LytR/AlgR family response regulator
VHILKKPRQLSRKNSLWRDAALWFAGLPPDSAIHRLLQRLGTRHHADRTWLLPANNGNVRVITHQWYAKGISPALHERRKLSAATYQWVMRQIRRHHELYIASPDKIPQRFCDLRNQFMLQGTCSLYCVPIFSGGELVATIGHHKLRQPHCWTRSEREEMHQAAFVIGTLLVAQKISRRGESTAFQKGTEPQTSIYIKQGETSAAVPAVHILLVRAALNYSQVTLANGRSVTQYRSMDQWQQILPKHTFMRVHRSYIVNIKKIVRLDRNAGHWHITLANRETLHIGRQYRKELLQRLKKRTAGT